MPAFKDARPVLLPSSLKNHFSEGACFVLICEGSVTCAEGDFSAALPGLRAGWTCDGCE